MILVSHANGNTFVRALLMTLQERNQLGLFTTAFGFAHDPAVARLLPGSLRREIGRRRYALPEDKIFSRPLREVSRLIAQRAGCSGLIRQETGWASVDSVYQDLDRCVAKRLSRWKSTYGLTAAYAYEDGALATLTAARAEGLVAAYDLPIAYWQTLRSLLREEASRLPEWEPTLLGGTRDSESKLERKTAELAAADIVVCPSQFVLDSLPTEARKKKTCLVAEFGTPEVPENIRAARRPGAKLRVLFAGSMSQRKGLGDLFAAMRLLKRSDIELVVMGSPQCAMSFYREQFADFTYESTRPHAEVLALMATCDVLCLPSIVEGRALVQQEAMAAGLPVVATANAGASDLIENGVTGFLVPIRDPQTIASRLDWMADNRDAVFQMGRTACERAHELTWSRYGEKIITALESVRS